MLLKRGANPYLENWYGNALHCAAEAGHSNTIRELIHYGMSVDHCPQYSSLPILCTLDSDRAEAFETLVTLGFDINTRDADGFTVLDHAEHQSCTNIINLALKRRWADEKSSAQGLTALHFAAICGNGDILLSLLKDGADVKAEDHKGRTPLVLARLYDNKDVLDMLLEYDAKDIGDNKTVI